MKYPTLLILAALLLAGGLQARPVGEPVELDAPTLPRVIADDGRGTPFIVSKKDNICGLDEPRQLTHPAVVDYDALIAATPEAKKIKKDKIDPASSGGITLLMKGRSRVLKACESVRQAGGHCSVWKKIKRRNKKSITDITDSVKRLL